MKDKPKIIWKDMEGSADALKWNQRDLYTLDKAMEKTAGRTACLQAGANLGIFPKYLSHFFTTVYTFEPSPKLFRVVCKNAPEENIIKFNAALGDSRNLVSMSQTRRTKQHMPAHEGITHVSGSGVIPTLLIDDLNLPVLDLLCLDLEGYEPFAILGAEKTLVRCKPTLLVEVNNNAGHYGYDRDDVRRMVMNRGYRLVERIMADELYVWGNDADA